MVIKYVVGQQEVPYLRSSISQDAEAEPTEVHRIMLVSIRLVYACATVVASLERLCADPSTQAALDQRLSIAVWRF
jgi:hypothetical protein